jgi:hypothetical protein
VPDSFGLWFTRECGVCPRTPALDLSFFYLNIYAAEQGAFGNATGKKEPMPSVRLGFDRDRDSAHALVKIVSHYESHD